MTRLELGRADLALFTDPIGSRVLIPHLVGLVRTRERVGVDVRFEGDEWPTPFDGEGRLGQLDLTCRYGESDLAQRIALEHLVDELAPARFDKRLLLRLHLDSGADLAPELQTFVAAGNALAVRIRRLVSTPTGAGNADITATATVVQHRFGA